MGRTEYIELTGRRIIEHAEGGVISADYLYRQRPASIGLNLGLECNDGIVTTLAFEYDGGEKV